MEEVGGTGPVWWQPPDLCGFVYQLYILLIEPAMDVQSSLSSNDSNYFKQFTLTLANINIRLTLGSKVGKVCVKRNMSTIRITEV